ncbi:VOC family protein [Salinimicrobium sp. GXAS 041]|uniref:VOC family protein n=1 Tax=Salinimicrobium sp. GXAS 041 TaxID=3400806 RepID=UPI003C795560
MKNNIQKIIPHLWFDSQAEEAVQFYTSIFKNSAMGARTHYSEAGKEFHQREPGSLMTLGFQLEDFKLIALNGGPHFQFNPSVSLLVRCETEEETERLWKLLSKNAKIMMPLNSYDWSPKYGWLQDRYGLSWQIMFEKSSSSHKIVPLLFFTGERHGKAEEAMNFYTSIFKNSRTEGITYYGEENQYAQGMVMHAHFELDGQKMMVMDSGVENDFPFNEAVSFIVECKDQAEIDYYWNKLTAGGDPAAQQCGWLKDKFGVSWQVVPHGMEEMLNATDKRKSLKAMEAMMQMKKINLAKLEKAFQAEPLKS